LRGFVDNLRVTRVAAWKAAAVFGAGRLCGDVFSLDYQCGSVTENVCKGTLQALPFYRRFFLAS
jgi:hypothetical protein